MRLFFATVATGSPSLHARGHKEVSVCANGGGMLGTACLYPPNDNSYPSYDGDVFRGVESAKKSLTTPAAISLREKKKKVKPSSTAAAGPKTTKSRITLHGELGGYISWRKKAASRQHE